MLKKIGAVAVLSCLFGCASSGSFTAITLTNTMQMHEDAGLVGEWQEFETATMQPYWDIAVAAVTKRGIEIHMVDNLAGLMMNSGIVDLVELGDATLWGYNTGDGHIYIDTELSVDEAFATLFHEFGHSLQPPELNGTGDAQVYAESFAYLVCLRLGLDTRKMTFPYMQGFEKRHIIIQKYADRLDAQVEAMLAELR